MFGERPVVVTRRRRGSVDSRRSSTESAQSSAGKLRVALFFAAIVVVNSLLRLFRASPGIMSIYAVLGLVLAYYFSSDAGHSWLHKSERRELHFWVSYAFALSTSTLFVPDSPGLIYGWSIFRILAESEPRREISWEKITLLGFLICLSSGYAVFCFVRANHRKFLEKRPGIFRNKRHNGTHFSPQVPSTTTKPPLHVTRPPISIDVPINNNTKALFQRLSVSTAGSSDLPVINGDGINNNHRRRGSSLSSNSSSLGIKSPKIEPKDELLLSQLPSPPGSPVAAANLKRIGSMYIFPETSVSSLSSEETKKIAQVQSAIESLDYTFIPQTVTHMLGSEKILRTERRVLRIFRDSTKTELGVLIEYVNLALLFHRIKDHGKVTRVKADEEEGIGDWGGSTTNHNRSNLMHLLAIERISDLNTHARAVLLDVLMVVRMMSNTHTSVAAQKWALNIILKCQMENLSLLKALTDTKGSIYTMHKLVYEDISDPQIREAVLSHIQRQAKRLEALISMGGTPARALLAMGPWRKIISDMDDTLLSSGGLYPAGIDATFPKNVIYPGVICFYRELDLGTHPDVENGVWPSDGSKVGNLVFLSARPHIYKDVAERRVYQKFENLMYTRNLHAMPMILPGDIESGQAFMMRGDFEPMAQKKFRNFIEYESLYPEYKHVFIGDNGQADVRAGELMKEKYGNRVQAVYIHEVQPVTHTFGFKEGVSLKKWNEMGIFFYKTLVGAALHACKVAKLIRPSGLARVMKAAVEEFEEIAFSDSLVRESQRLQLNYDLDAANDYLNSLATISSSLSSSMIGSPQKRVVPLIPADTLFPVGTTVYSRLFGEGYVRRFDPILGTYEIGLSRWNALIYSTPANLSSKPWKSEGKRFGFFSLPLDQSSIKHRESFNGTATLPLTETDVILGVGTKVHTKYGDGVVRRWRTFDLIYEVQLKGWGIPVIAYLQEKDITVIRSSRSNVISFVKNALFSRKKPSAEATDFTLADGKRRKKVSLRRASGGGHFQVGTQVVTQYGTGKVVCVRQGDPIMCEIQLEWGGKLFMPRGTGSSLTSPQNDIETDLKIEDDDDSLISGGDASSLDSGDDDRSSIGSSSPGRRPKGTRSRVVSLMVLPFSKAAEVGNRVITSGRNAVTRSASVSSMSLSPANDDFPPGTQVSTPFGQGKVITPARVEDGILQVDLGWSSMAFLHKSVCSVLIEKQQARTLLSLLLQRTNSDYPS